MQYSRLARFVLPVSLIASLMVILVPLPSGVMDLLIAANIAAAVLILLATVFVDRPLDLSVFPTILLVTTLGRLVLNVATTRLILTHAHIDGLNAAGKVIQGFGRFVAGDHVLVGVIIFSIIVLIQFLVITKGASRISEVAARFALDGMHGRQMAIDADLSSGTIDQHEAQLRRAEVAEQADFYGAMDGASKFLRGDAVAGLAIMAINVVGGLYLGVIENGMLPVEAASLYTKLTIGDGLVSQLPAFLISLGAGILITRGTSRTDLSVQFVRQLASRPEPLFVAAGFLCLLVFAKLPALPLIAIAAICVGLGMVMMREEGRGVEQSRVAATKTSTPNGSVEPNSDAKRSPAKGTAAEAQSVEDFLAVEPLALEVGVGLLRLADPNRGGQLLERVTTLRNQVASELGLVLPRVRIRDNLKLSDQEYVIKISDNVVARGVSYPLREFAIASDQTVVELEGIAASDPCSGAPAYWIERAASERAIAAGYRVLSASEAVMVHLAHIVRSRADELLTREATRRLVDRQREHSPTVVDELIPGLLGLPDVQRVLQLLIQENVSIRNLGTILETLSDHAKSTTDPELLVEHVRRRLGREIVGKYTSEEGVIEALRPGELVVKSLRMNGAESAWREFPEFARSLSMRLDWAQQQALRPVLLVPSDVRTAVRRQALKSDTKIVVLGESELPRDLTVKHLGDVIENQLVGHNS